jgi:hypothetical protein
VFPLDHEIIMIEMLMIQVNDIIEASTGVYYYRSPPLAKISTTSEGHCPFAP